MTGSEAAMVNTYVFTNIHPQYPGFNRTIWAALEKSVRTQVRRSGWAHITSGAIYDRDGDGHPDAANAAIRVGPPAGDKRLALATHFFKIVVTRTETGKPAIEAWLLEHSSEFVAERDFRERLEAARVPLERIEALSGFDFLPLLNAPPEQAAIH